MSSVLDWLRGGDLRSDGMSAEAAAFVLEHPELSGDLLAGLDDAEEVVRARAADALEKVARQRPELIEPALPRLAAAARRPGRPAEKMHLAMIFGHLALYDHRHPELLDLLLTLLEDPSVFTRSWSIASLCILARRAPSFQAEIVRRVGALSADPSVAIRTRVRKALTLLADESAAFPPGWVKSAHL